MFLGSYIPILISRNRKTSKDNNEQATEPDQNNAVFDFHVNAIRGILSCSSETIPSPLQIIRVIYETSNSSSFGLELWNSISDCCTWNRIVCSSHSRHITSLHLDNIPLPNYDTSPDSRILDPIYGIRSLLLLDISKNYIHGEISGKGLANLTKLAHLDTRGNHFNGSVPAQLFDLRFLQFLDLSGNLLEGGLSSVVGKLGNLRTLKLDNNLLDGYISVQIGNLTKLQQFSISNNRFSGRIPYSIGNLQGLEILVSTNNFTGVIPPSTRNLSRLATLQLEDNMLSGEFPYGLFDTKSLKNLYLGGNKMTWSNNIKIVPKFMLSRLFLKSCNISGNIPGWLSTQKKLDVLELSDNNLTGKFPLWLAEMEIEVLLLQRNKLSGSIPSRLFQSSRLSILAVSRNTFSGELPENIGDANKIKVLMLSANSFSGATPKSIADIPQLQILDLSGNRFSGDKFPVFDPNGSLAYIDFSSNELSGQIPVSFLTGTNILALGGNNFSGKLLKELTNMNELIYLDLHDDNITGSFPEFLSQISGLKVLSVRNNSLHGSLPPNSFSSQSALQILDLSSNDLVGSIPSGLGNLRGMSGEVAEYLSMFNFNDELQVDTIQGTVTSFDDTFSITLEINDLIVNWKNAVQQYLWYNSTILHYMLA